MGRTLGHHLPRHRLAEDEGAVQIDAEHAPEKVIGHLEERRPVHDAGVVDQHVDAAPTRDDMGDGCLGAGPVHDVEGERLGLTASVGDGFGLDPSRGLVTIGDQHAGPFSSQPGSDRGPDASRAAGDDGGFVLEAHGIPFLRDPRAWSFGRSRPTAGPPRLAIRRSLLESI